MPGLEPRWRGDCYVDGDRVSDHPNAFTSMPFFDFTPASVAPTILGWTPGLRSLVNGRRLACGCLTGTYLTWRDSLVVIVDARVDSCIRQHRENLLLWQAGTPALAPFEDPSSFADPA